MKARLLDITYGAVFLAGAGYLFWISTVTGTGASRISSDPMWYPKLLLVLLAICSGALMLREALKRGHRRVPSLDFEPVLIVLATSGVYLALFQKAGFVPASLVLIPLTSWLLGFRRPLVLTMVSIGFVACVWYGFHYLINITPPGPGLPTLAG
ncbi:MULTISPECIES: tripartite tricarboxylate transporter TctB family protein [unclassified Halomonas]|uniref:tripartite tricarboxylate transporter TctB family protein n=1 Tax=unclassified Halomonas TaxID=2609666 RepID=UPI002076AE37|nr:MULTISPECIES: tripartite tricarboxylate transporter TctB family protein [unclassified Halomonas]